MTRAVKVGLYVSGTISLSFSLGYGPLRFLVNGRLTEINVNVLLVCRNFCLSTKMYIL